MADGASNIADSLRLRLVVLRCQAGDDAAFSRLMAGFGPSTHRYLRSLVADDADDVQQELWLAVHRHLATLTDPGAFRTWLFRAARHRAIDWLRRARRERALFDDEAPIDEVATPDGPDESPLDIDLVMAEIDRLPPAQREVILLRDRDGMSYAEMALVIGSPVGTIRSRLHHARARLQMTLNQHSHLEGERQ